MLMPKSFPIQSILSLSFYLLIYSVYGVLAFRHTYILLVSIKETHLFFSCSTNFLVGYIVKIHMASSIQHPNITII